jgi:hypothetical protein
MAKQIDLDELERLLRTAMADDASHVGILVPKVSALIERVRELEKDNAQKKGDIDYLLGAQGDMLRRSDALIARVRELEGREAAHADTVALVRQMSERDERLIQRIAALTAAGNALATEIEYGLGVVGRQASALAAWKALVEEGRDGN